jgi:hypothetical protein
MPTEAAVYPTIVAPVAAAALTPEQAAQGHRTITMEFPEAVTLTVDWGKKIEYPKGAHEVPEYLAGHFFLKAHGVRPYNRPFVGGQIVEPTADEIKAVTGRPAARRQRASR